MIRTISSRPTTAIRFLTILLSLLLTSNHSSLAQDDNQEATDNTVDPSSNTANTSRSQHPTSENYLQWLSEKVDPSQAQWLDTDKQFLSLFRENRLAKEMGAIILVPDSGQHAGAAAKLKSIHNYMPEHGWHSLTLSLPIYNNDGQVNIKKSVHGRLMDQTSSSNSTTAEGNTINSETSDEEVSAEPGTNQSDNQKKKPKSKIQKENVAKRIESAASFLLNKKVPSLSIIALGSSAVLAARYLVDNKIGTEQVNALIFIDAKNSSSNDGTDELVPLINQLKIPILDIYSASNFQIKDLAKYRKRHTIMKKDSKYQQIALPSDMPAYDQLPNQLAKRIRGWLTKQPAKK